MKPKLPSDHLHSLHTSTHSAMMNIIISLFYCWHAGRATANQHRWRTAKESESHEQLLPSQEVGPTEEALAPVIQSATPKLEPVTHSAGGRLPFNIIPVLQVLFL